ncbi:diguanylate cyclase (GGDEF) domain-containing protein [Devosia sp. YR412]|uniref:GGDEF domain-containing protein n=1 Tax=Devosia sp. YR412 TaxID=1881030 RepID=UPI0008C32371|nr:GGDEF domain-containing protein [Devosia sp. YR412]SEQ04910.1 diguanylate cyclase (GGDEF) domain-containing protein [Devosia sp. YR412]
MIDNATLLIAIAFSSAALMVALLIGWLNARRETYLAYGSSGIGFVVIAMTVLGLRNGSLDFWLLFTPYALLLTGFGLIYAASRLFRDRSNTVWPAAVVWALAMLALTLPLAFGLTGVGVFNLNAVSAIFMLLCAWEYWLGRRESPVALIANAVLYVLSAASFVACCVMIAIDGQLVLTAMPNNWAERFNSIMSLVGLTGIGAITLTLHHSRAARMHRLEANTDSMTGLLNRRALFDRFERRELPLGTAVLMFDIDHFKQINDRHGHAIGDAVISHLGAVLRSNMRDQDAVARIGGEEFCAVLQPMSVDQAKIIAERIRGDFELSPARLVSGTFPATVSVGVATSGTGESFSSVLNRADNALYRAKDDGRNRVTTATLRLIA